MLQKVSADLQTARAAHGLYGGHTAGGDRLGTFAKDQAFDGAVVGGNAVNRQIATRSGLFHHGFFRCLHALQQGQFAVLVEIHADAQIDFSGVGIGVELFVQTQNRVARGHFDGGEKRHEVVLKKLEVDAPASTRGKGKSRHSF